MQGAQFSFTFFRFIGDNGNRHTELVRNYNQADGMRGLVERKPEQIQQANPRVSEWASGKVTSF